MRAAFPASILADITRLAYRADFLVHNLHTESHA